MMAEGGGAHIKLDSDAGVLAETLHERANQRSP